MMAKKPISPGASGTACYLSASRRERLEKIKITDPGWETNNGYSLYTAQPELM